MESNHITFNNEILLSSNLNYTNLFLEKLWKIMKIEFKNKSYNIFLKRFFDHLQNKTQQNFHMTNPNRMIKSLCININILYEKEF